MVIETRTVWADKFAGLEVIAAEFASLHVIALRIIAQVQYVSCFHGSSA
jgi:hypothetical protein